MRIASRPLFWGAILLILPLALLPRVPRLLPAEGLDHVLAFAVAAAVGLAGWRHRGRMLLALASFAVMIEMVQLVPMLGRDADADDLAASLIGIVVGLLFDALRRGWRRWMNA